MNQSKYEHEHLLTNFSAGCEGGSLCNVHLLLLVKSSEWICRELPFFIDSNQAGRTCLVYLHPLQTWWVFHFCEILCIAFSGWSTWVSLELNCWNGSLIWVWRRPLSNLIMPYKWMRIVKLWEKSTSKLMGFCLLRCYSSVSKILPELKLMPKQGQTHFKILGTSRLLL